MGRFDDEARRESRPNGGRGDDLFSLAGFALSTVGAVLGILAGYRLAQSIG